MEQDLEYAIRRLVEIGLRALSPGINDPMTAIAVLDRLGAALCELASRRLQSGVTRRDGKQRLVRGVTDYPGLIDAMFHMLRQAGTRVPAVMIRLLKVLAEVGAVGRDHARIQCLRRHADLTRDAALRGTQDAAAVDAVHERYRTALDAMEPPDARQQIALQ